MPKFNFSHTNIKSNSNSLAQIKQFTMPVLREGTEVWYIEFYCFDPTESRMRRKRIKINRIQKKCDRRKYANIQIKRLYEQLVNGWNPWIEGSTHTELRTFAEVCDLYEKYVDKMYNDGLYRKETFVGYKSFIKNVREYNSKRSFPIYYIYQFDKKFCTDLLDTIFIERNNSAQTRNNYLGFLRLFSSYCVSRGFLTTKPTDGIEPISKRLIKKGRTVIPEDVVHQIGIFLNETDKHFLLVCYLIYYCLIRPVEITRLKISCIDIKSCTITIDAEVSKNKQTQTITIPKKVILFAAEIGIFGYPSNYHIFSEGLIPGMKQIDTKIFRDHWAKVRKALSLKKEWKLYSLKDTGITDMLDSHTASISVRDQARHSSLAITEIYTRHGNKKADREILEFDGSL